MSTFQRRQLLEVPHVATRPVSPALNFDILANVLEFIDTHHDLLAAMRTCRTLYAAGLRPLVRLHYFIRDGRIQEYHNFMLAHAPASFSALEELDFMLHGDVDYSDNDIACVIDLLQKGVNIRELFLPEDLVYMGKGIPEAVASLTKLETLMIEGETPQQSEFILTRLHSPLATLVACFDPHGSDDPVPILAKFRNTLQEAELSCVMVSSTEFCYPSLTALKIDRYYNMPTLSVFATVFPNLQWLTIGSSNSNLRGEAGMAAALDQQRVENIAFQEDHKCWKSLESVAADLVSFHSLGLKNDLKSLQIAAQRNTSKEDCLACFQAIIPSLHTRALTVQLRDEPDVLSQAFRGMTGTLEMFEISLTFWSFEQYGKTLVSVVFLRVLILCV